MHAWNKKSTAPPAINKVQFQINTTLSTDLIVNRMDYEVYDYQYVEYKYIRFIVSLWRDTLKVYSYPRTVWTNGTRNFRRNAGRCWNLTFKQRRITYLGFYRDMQLRGELHSTSKEYDILKSLK
jgi:hypothetical protein